MGDNKLGQVTIFIIIAVIFVALIAVVFILRGFIFRIGIPASIEPVYTSFLTCLEDETSVGINVLETHGGYIELPEFEPGSRYMPFSSQLGFVGTQIPYWYYVSGNNVQKEQVPSEEEMGVQLENFIQDRIRRCVFGEYYEQGFEINQGEPKAMVNIKDNQVDVSLEMDLVIRKGEDSVNLKNHNVVVKSNLGQLYNSAKKVYDTEQRNLFLEEYAVDILRLNAPVDGVELTCSPLTWNADEVFDELENAIEANVFTLKTKGGDFSLKEPENKYFVIDLGINEEVRFINSKEWPNAFEVAPAEGNVLISKPVGNQPGLGVLGFCYVPYHFVYTIKYPVLIQVQSGDEIFQFPVAVVLQGNMPREALDISAVEENVYGLCENKNTLINVRTHDTKLNPIDAEISYKCSGTTCDIGKTSGGYLEMEFPQCVNGFVLARADGFEDSKTLFSVIESGTVDVIMNKLYPLSVNLKVDGAVYNGNAVISFISDDFSKTVVYPEQKTVELIEGQYEIQAYVYRETELRFEEISSEQCMEVPSSGLGGFFGLTKKKCFDITIPSQVISNALAGGGSENYYILESELEKNIIEINAPGLPVPNSLEDLQNNYLLFEDNGLDINFK